jgi:hypothetical protein
MKTVWVYFAKEAQGYEKPDLIIFDTEEPLVGSEGPRERRVRISGRG